MTDRSAEPVLAAILDVLKEQGLSRRELARRIGWGRMRTQHLLSGNTRLGVTDLQEIATALGVPVSRFLPEDQPAGDAR
jgi:transcriptional regulator with XRE-family HTH domain